jgi:hypothetical protein
MMDQQLAQHADASGERQVARSSVEEPSEGVAKERVLLERPLSGPVGTMRMRIDELLFDERVTHDFIRERAEQAALRSFFGLVEQLDDPTMLFFENVFER